MPLTDAQKVDLSKLVGETLDSTKSALSSAARIYSSAELAEIETELASLVTSFASVENKHLRVSGGRDGVDLDYERNRKALRERARILLGLSPVSDAEIAGDPNAVRVAVLRGASW